MVSRDNYSFQVSVVDYTWQRTILGGWQVGDTVNLEVDIIAKYIERFQHGRGGITIDFLEEHGFLMS